MERLLIQVSGDSDAQRTWELRRRSYTCQTLQLAIYHPLLPVLQAFATKSFPEATKMAARAVFPMHANLDEKIKEKFGRGTRGGSSTGSSESRKELKSA